MHVESTTVQCCTHYTCTEHYKGIMLSYIFTFTNWCCYHYSQSYHYSQACSSLSELQCSNNDYLYTPLKVRSMMQYMSEMIIATLISSTYVTESITNQLLQRHTFGHSSLSTAYRTICVQLTKTWAGTHLLLLTLPYCMYSYSRLVSVFQYDKMFTK